MHPSPPVPSGPVAFGARSDAGRVRDGNEDRLLARPPLFAVADGMGGHRAGEVAAQMAVDLLAARLDGSPSPSPQVLAEAVGAANREILGAARRRSELAGMGTTCTVALLDGYRLHLAHVGDTRAYRLTDGRLEALTQDHTLVGDLVRGGVMSEAAARADDRRHILTRGLGVEVGVAVDTRTVELAPGDRLLLCSDGLPSELPDDAIARLLLDEPDPRRAADRLVDAANAAGGRDNVSVLVIDLLPPGAALAPSTSGDRAGRRLALLVAAGLIAVLGGLGALALEADVAAPGATSRPAGAPSSGSPAPTASPTPSLAPGDGPGASPGGAPTASPLRPPIAVTPQEPWAPGAELDPPEGRAG